MSLLDKLSPVLSYPASYLLYQTLVGGIRARRICIRDYVQPAPHQSVLDIGCGPGYTVRYFPQPQYYGFDVSPRYVSYASRRFSRHGRFFCRLFDEAVLEWLPPIDVVLLMGLLHHLDDASARLLFDLIKRALKPDGQLVTLDGCYQAGQSRLARYFLDCDRGKFVRDEQGYVKLATEVFRSVRASVRDDLFHIPYTALILQCRL